MEIIVSSVIGGQIVAEVGMERVLHQLIIEMRKSLKKQFANNSFDGLDKTKINIYISGDVSEYCIESGITKCRYLRKKKEIISEFCIDRYYWTSEPLLDVKRKFLLFIKDSFVDLGVCIKKKLKSEGYDFDSEVFKEMVVKSLIEL